MAFIWLRVDIFDIWLLFKKLMPTTFSSNYAIVSLEKKWLFLKSKIWFFKKPIVTINVSYFQLKRSFESKFLVIHMTFNSYDKTLFLDDAPRTQMGVSWTPFLFFVHIVYGCPLGIWSYTENPCWKFIKTQG